jgi:hypothetical protein
MCYRTSIILVTILVFYCCAEPVAGQKNCTRVDRVRIQLQWVLQAQFAGTAANL